MSTLDVTVALDRPVDAAGFANDALAVTARNRGRKPVIIVACCMLLPLGLHVYAEPAQA